MLRTHGLQFLKASPDGGQIDFSPQRKGIHGVFKFQALQLEAGVDRGEKMRGPRLRGLRLLGARAHCVRVGDWASPASPLRTL